MTSTDAPVTGAKPEQIEAAIDRYPGATSPGSEKSKTRWREHMRYPLYSAAVVLVPPGMVIENRANVITPEARAAIGRAIDVLNTVGVWRYEEGRNFPVTIESDRRVMQAQINVILAIDAITDADLALLESIANGGAS